MVVGGAFVVGLAIGWIASQWWQTQPTGRERPIEFFRRKSTGDIYRRDMVVVRQENRMDRDHILYNVEQRDMESWPTAAFEAEFELSTSH